MPKNLGFLRLPRPQPQPECNTVGGGRGQSEVRTRGPWAGAAAWTTPQGAAMTTPTRPAVPCGWSGRKMTHPGSRRYDWISSKPAGRARVMVYWVGIAQIVIALAVVGALLASVWAVVQARKTAHANMVSVFLEEYASQRMHDDLWALGEFRDEKPDVIDPLRRLVTHVDDLNADDVKCAHTYAVKDTVGGRRDVDPARRHVYNFYKRAWRLHENGYLGKKALSIIADTNGVELLFDVAHPLTRATHLNIFHKDNLQRFRDDLARFDWLGGFSKFVEENVPPESDMKDRITPWVLRIIPWGLMGVGILALIYLNTDAGYPMTMDNMDKHSTYQAAAALLIGVGVGHIFSGWTRT